MARRARALHFCSVWGALVTSCPPSRPFSWWPHCRHPRWQCPGQPGKCPLPGPSLRHQKQQAEEPHTELSLWILSLLPPRPVLRFLPLRGLRKRFLYPQLVEISFCLCHRSLPVNHSQEMAGGVWYSRPKSGLLPSRQSANICQGSAVCQLCAQVCRAHRRSV